MASSSNNTYNNSPSSREKLRLQLERRRETCRRNQQRYRDRLKAKAAGLPLPVTPARAVVDPVEQQARRRATCRRNQRKYRERLKREKTLEHQHQRWLEHHCAYLTRYNRLLLQQYQRHQLSGCGAPSQQLRQLIGELFLAYFRGGLELQEQLQFRRAQEDFVRFNFAANVRVSEKHSGVSYLLQQLELLSVLYQFRLEAAATTTATTAAADDELCHVPATLTLTIRHHTVRALYPHMLTDRAFMEQALGQTLVCPLTFVLRFDRDNKVEAFEAHYDVAGGWCRLLRDARLVVKVLSQQRLTAGLIDDDVLALLLEKEDKSRYLAIETIMN